MKNGEIPLYSLGDLEKIRNGITEELAAAAKGSHTTFAFARHRYRARERTGERTVQVMVIGGTNMTAAIVRRKNDTVEIDRSITESLPILESKSILLNLIDDNFDKSIPSLSINFAYPMEPVSRDDRLDGVLLKGTKEHKFSGLVGERIGETVERHLRSKTGERIDVALANDTVCLVLSGVDKWKRSTLAGGVVGTGCNFGFFLDNDTVINIESGNFDGFIQTDTGSAVDEASEDRGSQRLEKEISGAFLFRHYNIYAKESIYERQGISSTRDLAEIASGGYGAGTVCARRLFERSASLVAALIAGIYDFKNAGDMNFLIEGSLYWKGWNYPVFVDMFLREMKIPAHAVSIHCIEHSSVIGASMLW